MCVLNVCALNGCIDLFQVEALCVDTNIKTMQYISTFFKEESRYFPTILNSRSVCVLFSFLLKEHYVHFCGTHVNLFSPQTRL